MSQEKHLYSRNELIDQIKHCGQSIIDNAESILGNERYFESITIIFDINRNRNCIPDIQIQRRFIPDLEIEDLKTYKELKQNKNENEKHKVFKLDIDSFAEDIYNRIPIIDGLEDQDERKM